MNDLRLHKGVVPRHEKFKEARRLAQATRQRAARSSLLQGLRHFLTSDSFMYGPLLELPAPTVQISDDSEPRTPDREQEDGDFDGGSTRNDANGTEKGKSSEEHDSALEETPTKYQESRTTKTYLSVTRGTPRSGRTVVPPADGSRTLKSTVPVNMSTTTTTTIVKMQMRGNEGSFLFGNGDQGTSSMTSSYDDDDFTLLNTEKSCQVVRMLLSKVGGRYSKDLGIDVEAGEDEVEKWFLAVALFHRHLTFDVLKKTFQKLTDAGIVSVRGMLQMEEEDIANILETAGYTTYKHRAASRMRRLALQLEAAHKGKVSDLKQIQDSHELCRHITNMHGLTTHTCNIFLRELRGVWPGAASDNGRRTKRAAMHLRVAEFDKAEDSNKSSVLNSQTWLKSLAERSGVDERDLEVGLVKLGLAHERHYRECPGGSLCNFLVSDEQVNPEGLDLTG